MLCTRYTIIGTLLLGVLAVSARADFIPMAYDFTNSAVLSDCTFETGGPTEGVLTLSTGSGIVSTDGTATPYEGSQFLKISGSNAKTWVGFDYQPAGQSITTVDFAVQLASDNAMAYVAFSNNNTSWTENVARFEFHGDGSVRYYNSAGNLTTISGLSHVAGQWNEVVLTHVNGTANWEISVNGSESKTVNMSYYGSYLARPWGFTMKSGNNSTTAYFDAVPVPEPATAAMLAAAACCGMFIGVRKLRRG